MAFSKKLGFAAAALFGAVAFSSLTLRAEEAGKEEQPNPERQEWSFAGPFGTFDRAQLQRGFKVYKEVCSNCHELHIPIRTLGQPGGPGFSEDQVKALAASYTVHDGPNLAGRNVRPSRSSFGLFPCALPESGSCGCGARQRSAGHVAAGQGPQI